MTAIGLNRENDTPIGGAGEFRGNLISPMSLWSPDDVPAWDGTKFAPASNSGLLQAYGGLATKQEAAAAADGSLITGWDDVMPFNGTPLQTVVDALAGTVTVIPVGVYEISFAANLEGLANNQRYDFLLNIGGVDQPFGAIIAGSNQVSTGEVSFNLTAQTNGASEPIGVSVTNVASSTYIIISASLSIKRIG